MNGIVILVFCINDSYISARYDVLCAVIIEIALIIACVNFRKAIISFVMSVRPSDHMEKLGSHWTDYL
jgi:hypothetical protein